MMRLIDADTLEGKSKVIYMELENVAVPIKVISISELYLAPVVDAEPVRHGRWIRYGNADIWRCTECDKYAGYLESYCPNCGTKMDAEVKGND